MAGTPSRFVDVLTDEDREQLQYLYEHSDSPQIRQRAHSVLLSHSGYSMTDITSILGVSRDTVSRALNRWDNWGFERLGDAPRSGAPPKLTDAEVTILLELTTEFPHSPKQVLEKLREATGKTISNSTRKKILRKARLTWKRMRKSVKNKRNEEDFRKGQQEVKRLEARHDRGEIDLYFCDETGFSLTPTVPYGWQRVGITIGLPSARSKRINTLGFLGRNDRFSSYTVEGNIDSVIVISCIDDFCRGLTKPTVVVIDNASMHTSKAFLAKMSEWEALGLTFYHLPPYSPELNLIETLWRLVKHHWLPLSAYDSFESLRSSVAGVLGRVGSTLRIQRAAA